MNLRVSTAVFAIFLAMIAIGILKQAAVEAAEYSKVLEDKEYDECNLYLAPSSIPSAGFGIFSVSGIQKGEYISPYAESPYIPICDFPYDSAKSNIRRDYVWKAHAWSKFECNDGKFRFDEKSTWTDKVN